jgi:hypothetical protein
VTRAARDLVRGLVEPASEVPAPLQGCSDRSAAAAAAAAASARLDPAAETAASRLKQLSHQVGADAPVGPAAPGTEGATTIAPAPAYTRRHDCRSRQGRRRPSRTSPDRATRAHYACSMKQHRYPAPPRAPQPAICGACTSGFPPTLGADHRHRELRAFRAFWDPGLAAKTLAGAKAGGSACAYLAVLQHGGSAGTVEAARSRSRRRRTGRRLPGLLPKR